MDAAVFGLISGMLTAGFLVIALFFAKFLARTHDRLFAFFAVAFVLLAIERSAFILSTNWVPEPTWLYFIRLAAFLVIAVGVWDKNRR